MLIYHRFELGPFFDNIPVPVRLIDVFLIDLILLHVYDLVLNPFWQVDCLIMVNSTSSLAALCFPTINVVLFKDWFWLLAYCFYTLSSCFPCWDLRLLTLDFFYNLFGLFFRFCHFRLWRLLYICYHFCLVGLLLRNSWTWLFISSFLLFLLSLFALIWLL